MLNILRQIFIFLLVTIAFSCKNTKTPTPVQKLTTEEIANKLIEANKAAISLENTQIDSLIKISDWRMQQTPTGLRYEIITKGNGELAAQNQFITLDFKTYMFPDQLVYSSQTSGPRKFRIGSGGVESGLEEAVLLLKKGDSARLIIPSYLAHGLSGDQDKIPPRTSLIYYLKVLDLQ